MKKSGQQGKSLSKQIWDAKKSLQKARDKKIETRISNKNKTKNKNKNKTKQGQHVIMKIKHVMRWVKTKVTRK